MEDKRTIKGQSLKDYYIIFDDEIAVKDFKLKKLLYHPMRQKLYRLLEKYPDQLCLFELAIIVDAKYTKVLYHLDLLLRCEILEKYYVGVYVYYRIKDGTKLDETTYKSLTTDGTVRFYKEE